MEPPYVGLIPDSSVVIAGERRGHTVRQILKQFKTGYGEIEIRERRPRRQAFVDKLIRDVPVHPVTLDSPPGCRIEGDQAAQGVNIAFEDR